MPNGRDGWDDVSDHGEDPAHLDADNGWHDPVEQSLNGHVGRLAPGGAGEPPDADRTEHGWIGTGGVLRWEEPEDTTDPRHELDSPLAADTLDLPPGAPDAPRLRAVHAWMVRQRAAEHEALAVLLVTQREQTPQDETARQRRRRDKHEPSPLDLAIAEHQAAAEEYDTLLEALDDHVAHSGPGRALVEYYLWLNEHLAALAAQPEAAHADGPPTSPSMAAWLGCAHTALGVRRRVEQVSLPEPDE